jgi:hypothetical protein
LAWLSPSVAVADSLYPSPSSALPLFSTCQSVCLLYAQRLRLFQCCPLTHYSLPHETEVMRCYLVENFRVHVTDKVTDSDVFVAYIGPWTVWHTHVYSGRGSFCNELVRVRCASLTTLLIMTLSCLCFCLGGGGFGAMLYFYIMGRNWPVPSWPCSQPVGKPVWHIPLLCVQWKTPDDGHKNCPKHVEFYSKNKFEKWGPRWHSGYGAVLQIGRSLFRSQLVSLEFFIVIKSSRPHYGSGGRLSL